MELTSTDKGIAKAGSVSASPSIPSKHMQGKAKKAPVSTIQARLDFMELSSLFKRLDSSGDGKLDEDEFKGIISKLNLGSEAVTKSIKDTFNDAVGEAKEMSRKHFVKAYGIVYNHLLDDVYAASREEETKNFVRATRYGYYDQDLLGDKKYMFECYTGTMTNIIEKHTFIIPAQVDDDASEFINVYDIKGFSDQMHDDGKCVLYKVEQLPAGYNIEVINRMILADGKRNVDVGRSVRWWVDICSEACTDAELDYVVRTFGIPSAVKPNLSQMDDTRVSFGAGEVICRPMFNVDASKSLNSHAYHGNAAVLSMFAQGIHVKNVPVVERDPVIAQKLHEPTLGFSTYASSKISFIYSSVLPNFYAGTKCTERARMARLVQSEVDKLMDAKLTGDVKPAHSPAAVSQALPVVHEDGDIDVNSLFLLSVSDLKKRKPELVRDNISVHVQDQGYGPIACISFRQVDTENDVPGSASDCPLSTRSKAGVIGRTINGIWIKLLEVIANEGAVGKLSELTDSSFSLAACIVTTLHNGCMQMMHKLEYWQSMLKHAIEDIAVTKYSTHIDILSTMLTELKDYLSTFAKEVGEISDFYKEVSRVDKSASYESEDEEEIVTAKPTMHEAKLHRTSTVVVKNRRTSIVVPAVSITTLIAADCYGTVEDVLVATKELLSENPYLKPSLRYSKLDTAGRYDMFKIFAGDHIREITNLLTGGRKASGKGVERWIEHITDLQDTMEDINVRYQTLLDEKRNFWSFIMGIVAIATFPFAVMTGYFGMNFENMANEGAILTNEYFPAFPGEKIIWFLTMVVYSIMLILALHWDILYSAT